MMMMAMIIIIILGNFIMAMRLVLSAESSDMRLKWYANIMSTEVKHKNEKSETLKVIRKTKKRTTDDRNFSSSRYLLGLCVGPAASHSVFICGASPLSSPRSSVNH